MGRRLREALITGLLLMLLSQFCGNVFAQEQYDIVFSRDLSLTETFRVNTEYFSQNITINEAFRETSTFMLELFPLNEAFRETSLYLAERFVFNDVFSLSFHAFLMDLSIGGDIGVNKFSPLLESLSFSEYVHEFIERFRAVGGTVISQVPLKNLVTIVALLIGSIGILFIVKGIKAKKR